MARFKLKMNSETQWSLQPAVSVDDAVNKYLQWLIKNEEYGQSGEEGHFEILDPQGTKHVRHFDTRVSEVRIGFHNRELRVAAPPVFTRASQLNPRTKERKVPKP